MINTQILVETLKDMQISYTILDEYGDFVRLNFEEPKYFIQSKTPFNNDGISFLCKDKEFTYRLLKDELKIPKTIGYVDPKITKEFYQYSKFKNINKICDDLEIHFTYPVIIKMNTGLKGNNVFLCQNRESSINALKTIFNKKRRFYDHVAIVQKMLEIEKEYRVIWFKGQILLIYEKFCDNKKENLSPFRNANSKAIKVVDNKLLMRINNFLMQSKSLKQVEFGGFDLVIDKYNEIWLLELNTFPGFKNYVKHNGKEDIINIYKALINDLQKNA